MNTKSIMSLIVGVVLGGSIMYMNTKKEEDSSQKFSKEQVEQMFEEIEDFNAFVDLDSSMIDEMRGRNVKFDSMSGDFQTDSVAGKNWKSFRKWNTKRGNLIKEIKPNGFGYGLEKLKMMMAAIKKTNEDLRNRGAHDSLLIIGVRLNLTHTPQKGKKPTIDGLFAPVVKGGRDFISLEKKEPAWEPSSNNFRYSSSNLLLNASVPCPDNCGSASGNEN